MTGWTVRKVVASILLIVCAAYGIAESPDAGRKAAAAFYDGMHEHTLDNGLRVYLKKVPDSPIVCVMTTYRVGAADEELDRTGLSHYLEHLMFKGTDKLMPGDIDKLTRRAGGQNNAYTTPDFTNFHFEFAADRWETALEIEADRMRNLRIDARHEFEQEKGAVISELDGAEDEPWDLEHKSILPLLFGAKSPYGHPIIGEKAHVRGATAAIIKEHYDRWYHPNNAAIVIAGGFDPVRALARIKELFGSIPAGKLPVRSAASKFDRTGPAYKQFPSKFEVDRLLIGFNTVRMGEPEDYVLDVIEGVLSNGKTGRLYRRLVVEQEVAAEVTCSNLAGRLPGWFAIEMEVLSGVDPKKAEKALVDQLRLLAEKPIDEAELKRVKRSILANFIFAHEGVHDLADSIATTAAMADLNYVRTYFEKLDAVTIRDVQDVARRLLDPEKRVVVCSKAESAENSIGAVRPRHSRNSHARHSKWTSKSRSRQPAAVRTPVADFTKAKRVVLPNGLTLLLWENRRLPIFLAEAHVKNVRLLEAADKAGVAALVGVTLEEGTATRTEEQISRAIDDVGGSLMFTTGGGHVKVLSTDQALGLELFFDCLLRPKFSQQAVLRWREHLQSELENEQIEPASRCDREFLKRIYEGHPLGRSEYGTEESLEAVESEDCRNFHRTVYVPNNVILVIAGDFDAGKIVDDIKRRTAEWKPATLPKLNVPAVSKPARFTEKIVTRRNAAQVNVNLGHVGIRRGDPDYYKLLVMDHILGVGAGLSDRLASHLRDRNGLAYEVTASITASAGVEPGVFQAYVGTYGDKFLDVKKMLFEEIDRFRRDGPTEEEVADARGYLIGSFPFRMATLQDVAGELIKLERFELGFDCYRKFRREIGGVTPADILAAAKKHLDLEKMILVAVGPIDSKGRPLTKR